LWAILAELRRIVPDSGRRWTTIRRARQFPTGQANWGKQMADKNFDQYEYVAVIIPGATLLFGLSIEWPQYLHMASENEELSLGELGLFLIAAFIAGQLLQSLGDVLERPFWALFGGLPTNWVIKTNNKLITDAQRDQLQTRVRTLIAKNDFDIGTVDLGEWYSITRQIYAKVNAAKLAERVDAFNRTYGLMRGFAIALVILAIIFFAVDARLQLGFGAVALAILAFMRFYLFGRAYGRELFVQFLGLPP
jgi:hypothetical protein